MRVASYCFEDSVLDTVIQPAVADFQREVQASAGTAGGSPFASAATWRSQKCFCWPW